MADRVIEYEATYTDKVSAGLKATADNVTATGKAGETAGEGLRRFVDRGLGPLTDQLPGANLALNALTKNLSGFGLGVGAAVAVGGTLLSFFAQLKQEATATAREITSVTGAAESTFASATARARGIRAGASFRPGEQARAEADASIIEANREHQGKVEAAQKTLDQIFVFTHSRVQAEAKAAAEIEAADRALAAKRLTIQEELAAKVKRLDEQRGDALRGITGAGESSFFQRRIAEAQASGNQIAAAEAKLQENLAQIERTRIEQTIQAERAFGEDKKRFAQARVQIDRDAANQAVSAERAAADERRRIAEGLLDSIRGMADKFGESKLSEKLGIQQALRSARQEFLALDQAVKSGVLTSGEAAGLMDKTVQGLEKMGAAGKDIRAVLPPALQAVKAEAEALQQQMMKTNREMNNMTEEGKKLSDELTGHSLDKDFLSVGNAANRAMKDIEGFTLQSDRARESSRKFYDEGGTGSTRHRGDIMDAEPRRPSGVISINEWQRERGEQIARERQLIEGYDPARTGYGGELTDQALRSMYGSQQLIDMGRGDLVGGGGGGQAGSSWPGSRTEFSGQDLVIRALKARQDPAGEISGPIQRLLGSAVHGINPAKDYINSVMRQGSIGDPMFIAGYDSSGLPMFRRVSQVLEEYKKEIQARKETQKLLDDFMREVDPDSYGGGSGSGGGGRAGMPMYGPGGWHGPGTGRGAPSPYGVGGHNMRMPTTGGGITINMNGNTFLDNEQRMGQLANNIAARAADRSRRGVY